jgi:anti-sigma regulatory factor (Ser/Thr protein kinase)
VLELALHVLDAMRNSVDAGADRLELSILEDREQDRMMIELTDNGQGMARELAEKVLDPFVTTRKTRHVGLGLPLFAAAAHRCDGDFQVRSAPGEGTRLTAVFRYNHWDRAPLGDMPSSLLAILLAERPVDVLYTHRVGSRQFCFDSSEIRQELGDLPLSLPSVRTWMLKALQEGERGLRDSGGQFLD